MKIQISPKGGVDLLLVYGGGAAGLLPAVGGLEHALQQLRPAGVALLPVPGPLYILCHEYYLQRIKILNFILKKTHFSS